MSFNDLLETDYVKGRLQLLKREQLAASATAPVSADDGSIAVFQNGQAVPGTLEGTANEITVEATETGFAITFATSFFFKGKNTTNDILTALGLGSTSVANLAQTISNPPTQSEVQNIQAKLNDLLSALRAERLIAP